MSTNVLDQVRESCRIASARATYVHVDFNKVNEFVENHAASIEKYVEKMKDSGYPLNFEDDTHEVSFHVLYSALQFGSGFRKELHKYCGQGAAQTMTYGLLSMLISGSKLHAMDMSGITLADVESHFKIPVKVDVPHRPDSPIMIAQDSELKPLAEMIQYMFNDCGRILRGLQCEKGFGQFVENVLSEKNTPAYLVQELVKYFPSTFNDTGKIKSGETVYLFKKAQLVAGELYKNLGQRSDSQSKLAQFISSWTRDDVSSLTVFVDNVLPAMLVKEKVLTLDPELESSIQNNKALPAGPKETELRAVALHACELIVAKASGAYNAYELDYYLWGALGKEPEHRQFERHATKDTIYY